MTEETDTKEEVQEKAHLEVQEDDGFRRDEWLPSGIVTFEDFDAMEEANKQALQVKNDASLFKAIIDNILELEPEEGRDKQQMIRDVADSFAARMDAPILKEEIKDKDVHILEGASVDSEGKLSFTQRFVDSFKNILSPKKEEKKAQPGFSVWKSEDGQYHWLAAYSNNFRDNDNPPEIISAKSHEEFDQALDKGEWPMPDLWLWHVNYPVGQTLYHAYDKDNGFVVAGGVFNEGMEWAAEGVIKAEWDGVSHSMPTSEIERSKEDDSIITRHRTIEVSLLPNWAAANKLAFNLVSSKEDDSMAEKGLPDVKRNEFASAFGEDKVAAIEQAISGKAQEAKEEGVESKEVDTPETEAKEDEVPLTRKELFEALALVLDTVKDEVKAVREELTAVKENAEKEEPQDLVSLLEAHRAIGKDETRLDGRTKEAKDGPTATGDKLHPIGIIDSMKKSNEAWAVR